MHAYLFMRSFPFPLFLLPSPHLIGRRKGPFPLLSSSSLLLTYTTDTHCLCMRTPPSFPPMCVYLRTHLCHSLSYTPRGCSLCPNSPVVKYAFDRPTDRRSINSESNERPCQTNVFLDSFPPRLGNRHVQNFHSLYRVRGSDAREPQSTYMYPQPIRRGLFGP